jgi:hypothetical protein
MWRYGRALPRKVSVAVAEDLSMKLVQEPRRNGAETLKRRRLAAAAQRLAEQNSVNLVLDTVGIAYDIACAILYCITYTLSYVYDVVYVLQHTILHAISYIFCTMPARLQIGPHTSLKPSFAVYPQQRVALTTLLAHDRI